MQFWFLIVRTMYLSAAFSFSHTCRKFCAENSEYKLIVEHIHFLCTPGLRPLTVTLLPRGSFKSYQKKQRDSSADLIHLKPPHLNPADGAIEFLVNATP